MNINNNLELQLRTTLLPAARWSLPAICRKRRDRTGGVMRKAVACALSRASNVSTS